jgi:hypothetical protein
MVTLPASCNVRGIAAGHTSTFVAMKDGSVRGWGKISHLSGGKIEDLFSTITPKPIAGLQHIVQVAIRRQHLLARDIYGGVWAMGQNGFGQLGNGKSFKISGIGGAIDAASPIAVPNLTDIMDVAAADFHSLALDTSGKLHAWGYNGQGELGILDPKSPTTPVPSEVAQPTGVLFKTAGVVISMGTGHLHSFAVRKPDEAFTWGDNLQNELGITGAGKKVLKVQEVPREPRPYARILTWFAAESSLPMDREFYDAADVLFKTQRFETTVFEGIPALSRIRIENKLEGAHTELHVSEVRADVDIPDQLFDPSKLGQVANDPFWQSLAASPPPAPPVN